MSRALLLYLFFPAVLLLPVHAGAEDAETFASVGDLRVLGDDRSTVSLGAGAFDVIDDPDPAALFQGEFRYGEKLFFIGPTAGILGTTEGSILGYAGVYFDVEYHGLVLTPFAALGGYREGDGPHLGGTFQFYTGAELAYRFDDGSRLGVRVAHISNAGIHDRNPGVEMATVTYTVPFDTLLGVGRNIGSIFDGYEFRNPDLGQR